MEKSVLKHTGWLMLIVLAVLQLLNLLPGGTIGGHVLRRVDILGDVRPVPEVVSEPEDVYKRQGEYRVAQSDKRCCNCPKL